MAGTTFLTQQWYDKLLEEMQQLKNDKLPAVLERLKDAISQWDISENAEYDTSMAEKEFIEARIEEIKNILHDVEIIENTKSGDVRYGSIVTFKDDKGRSYTYTVVGTGEVNVLENTISLQSPLGMALRWKTKGDTVTVKAPSKRYDITITKVA